MKTFTLTALVAMMLTLALNASSEAQNLVRDSQFEWFHVRQPTNPESKSGQWGTGLYSRFGTWWNSRKAQAKAERIEFSDGSFGLEISNRSPATPHVFGTTSQRIYINKRAKKYRLSMWGKATNLNSNGTVQLVVDRKWNVRPISMPKGSYDWKYFTAEFDLSKVDTARLGYIDLRVLIQDTGSVQITQLVLEEVA